MKEICFLVSMIYLTYADGQLSSLRQFLLPPKPYLELGDTNWVYGPSLKVMTYPSKVEIPNSSYRLEKSILNLDTSLIHDSIWVQFRVFPYRVNKYFMVYDSSDHRESLPPEYSLLNKDKKTSMDEWWDNPNIEYTGNYNRGISIGNNQSLILNSALNLQLVGDLGDGLKITGAITDNQIPIQPEGNTRQIQEFDRLFIELKKNNSSLTAGDFDLNKPYGYFQNYFKKSLGGLVQTNHHFKNWNILQGGSIGISKGKFNRMTVPIINGNQGPYRLKGRDAENFIIILSASEKVFLDGVQLIRGEDADYVIDYNLGELRFTPKKLVTDQMRIFIEFEYTDQNFLRSLTTYNIKANKNNWNTYLNFYRENDSKKPSVANDLDSLEQVILSLSGDNPSLATSNRVIKAGGNYKPDRIYYTFKDTLLTIMGSTQLIKYLSYEEKSDSNSLQVTFSEVGQNKGEYQLIQSNANGRIYKWVGTDIITGLPLGSYAPYRILITPRNQTITSVGLEYINKNEDKAAFKFETSLSSLDLNRLSNVNDGDNIGMAGMAV